VRPVCTFWYLDTFETLPLVQFGGSRTIRITVQSNGTAAPVPSLSLCLRYEPFTYPLLAKSLPNSNIRYICNSSPLAETCITFVGIKFQKPNATELVWAKEACKRIKCTYGIKEHSKYKRSLLCLSEHLC
jgi:hypothetical protein